ncbi:YlzJ-like protein [Evansella caseinilytica]|uniref:YlzJ-like protein n=1 Tax=Evansella caseinilytica TaxID=1503961 RepID=A0A1H3M0N4_9BACI|nr:YlzJ-like family protein [Evansella caseinilytica]SDY69818.1 YlzJ-like protein [Evansella caseinilytica]
MILYTYQSQELVYPADEEDYRKQELVAIPGGQLLVEKVTGTAGPGMQYRIVRLLSTDPYLYLDERFQPGRYI